MSATTAPIEAAAKPARRTRSKVVTEKPLAEVATATVASNDSAQPVEVADELVDRAEIAGGKSLVKLSRSEALVIALRQKAAAIDFAMVSSDKDTEQAARQFRMEVMGSITSLKEQCLALRRPAADFSKMVIEAERLVEADLRSIHKIANDALTALDEERRLAREKKEAEQREAAQKILDAIAAISSRPTTLIGRPSSEIAEAITVLDAIDVSEEEFADKMGEAFKAKIDALAALRTMLAGTQAMEQQQQALAEQQAAIAKASAAQAAIDGIKSFALLAIGKTSAQIAELITKAEAIDMMDDVFNGRDVEAMQAQSAVVSMLRQQHSMTMAAEAMAAQQAQQQAELDSQAAAQREREAALAKAEADQREAAERAQREADERRAAIAARITRMVELPERLEAQEAGSAVIESELRTLNDTIVSAADYGDRQAEAESLRQRVLSELRNLHSLAVAAEEAAEAQRRADEEERQRVAAEQAAADAKAAAARARAQAAREAAPVLVALLLQWRDADQSGDAVAMEAARAERDRVITSLDL